MGAVIRISLFSRKPRMGSSSASCRSATIRRPAAYKAAALPAELRQHYRNPPRLSGCRLPENQPDKGERAIDRIRTGDLRITRALLCQLSYDGGTVPA